MKKLIALLGGLGLAISLVALPRFDVDRMSVTNGTILSGNYISLCAEDGDSLYLSPMFKWGPLSLEIETWNPGRQGYYADTMTLIVDVEVVSDVTLEQVDMFDFAKQTWVPVYQHVQKVMGDHQIVVTVPTKRFAGADGQLRRARISWYDSGLPVKCVRIEQMRWLK